jgi:hypothetical protein
LGRPAIEEFMNAQSLVLLAVCSLSVGGCGGKLEDPQRFGDLVKRAADAGSDTTGDKDAAVKPSGDAGPSMPAEPPACVTMLFAKTCGATVGCHDKTSTYVDLVSTGVASRLVDKDSKSALCTGKTYIATDGTASLLLQKVSATPMCGSRMPLGGTLTAAQTKCLSDWVVSLGGEAGGT